MGPKSVPKSNVGLDPALLTAAVHDVRWDGFRFLRFMCGHSLSEVIVVDVLVLRVLVTRNEAR